ncbi:hypothetical protein SCHPADRAFT_1003167 [Schizopora paradoxa]|uniref:BTB domain-containing protein n=1 Tax=Schizopora paradoxa TaxID=27342 RepID=A0A0H2QZ48_9AGAM|nr:hypothetical protein SCHPADRAFT_1003167 [Schizopora paradoxa]
MDVNTCLQRTESREAPKPHDSLWFFDGSVVLATDTLLFKVHKGFLSLKSSVFKDMFELPSPDGSALGEVGAVIMPELYEGTPMVTLVGDKGTDVEQLLLAVYEKRYINRDRNDLSLEAFAALLRLSTKYDFKDIRRELITLAGRHYPMFQSSYEFTSSLHCKLGVGQMFSQRRDSIVLLQAMFESNVDYLLPILYYSCCSFSMETILAEAHSIRAECLHNLLIGREKLQSRLKMYITKLPDILHACTGSTGCTSPDGKKCPHVGRFANLCDLLDTTDLYSIAGARTIYKKLLVHPPGICKGCRSLLMRTIESERQKIWEEIPSMFGYPGWRDLRAKMDAAVL